MTTDATALIILLAAFFGLILIRVPIAVALIAASVTCGLYLDIPLVVLLQKMVSGLNSFTFLAVPFFIIAGELMSDGGMSDKIIRLADAVVGKVRGGLAMVNVLASMLFGGISGSSVADVSAIGTFLIPLMKKKGYPADFATAVTVSGSVQGIIIPPSQNMIYYALAAGGLSISKLFIAGYIPGILFGCSLMTVCYVIAVLKKFPRGDTYSLRQSLRIFLDAIAGLFVIFIIIGGILFGIFTATESAAVASVYGLIITVFVYRSLGPRDVLNVFLRSLKTLSMIIAIIGASSVFAFLLAWLKVPVMVSAFFTSVSSDPLVVMLMVNLLLLVLGMLVDMGILILLMTPILLPVVTAVGFDPIHFGIIMMVNLGIGLCTPPVGTSLFVGCSIARISIEDAVKGFTPFYLTMLAILTLIILVPELSLWLPSKMR
ncbi:TRAP transporter large permease [Shumkonia mesophila]|uniref:TRAP transporter large permease n=1 Tax=Shumkonia mesophila TaxID=2838854 RepID=UPI0029351411|nr:TRAP transporter large permease [Shumkonia mesophila]